MYSNIMLTSYLLSLIFIYVVRANTSHSRLDDDGDGHVSMIQVRHTVDKSKLEVDVGASE